MRETKAVVRDRSEPRSGFEDDSSSADEPEVLDRQHPHRKRGLSVPNPRTAAEPASISGLVLKRVLGEHLARKACDSATLFASGTLEERGFSDVDVRVSSDDERKLWRKAERLTGDAEIGLHAGASVRPAAFDALGYIMGTSETLCDALAAAARYHRFVLAGTAVSFDANEDEGRFSIQLPPVLVAGSRHPIECAFAALVSIGRDATRSSFSPRAVTFQHKRAVLDSDAPGFFRAKIEYAAERSTLFVRGSDLRLPIAGCDPELRRILERHLADVLARLPAEAEPLARIRRELVTALGCGPVSLRATARRLGVGPRTLQRQLSEGGTTFRDVLESVRRELALSYVRENRLHAAEVGFLLGFARPNAFYRAFKRWTGGTPGEYRSEQCRGG
jgi:AraC-like DNA-binding protein